MSGGEGASGGRKKALILSLLRAENIETTFVAHGHVYIYHSRFGPEGLRGTFSFLSHKQPANAEVPVMYVCWVPDVLLPSGCPTPPSTSPPPRPVSPSGALVQAVGPGPRDSADGPRSPDPVADGMELQKSPAPNPPDNSSEELWSFATALSTHDLFSFGRRYEAHSPCLVLQTIDGVVHPPLYFRHGGLREVLAELRQRLHAVRTGVDVYQVADSPRQPLRRPGAGYLDDVLQRPGLSLLTWGSRVTQRVRETGEALFGRPPEPVSVLGPADLAAIAAALNQSPRPAAAAGSSSSSSPVDSPVEIPVAPVPESPSALWSGGKVTRDGPPVTEAEWHAAFDAEGRFVTGRWNDFRQAIFAGGLSPSLRATVWPFLVGFYSPTSTEAERADLRQRSASEYDVVRNQWRSISEAQAAHFAEFRERRDRIERDVVRTDRCHSFYDDPANGRRLNDILLTYAFYNFDLGYCQGMSDIASTLLMLLQDEALTFWCFVHTMEVLGGNFQSDGCALKAQLDRMGHILAVVDPPLSEHMNNIESGHLYCSFRWILVRFRREFAYPNILTLWEVLWTAEAAGHGSDYHLWMCVCLLHRQRNTILGRRMKADDLLRHANDLSGTLSADELVVHTNVLAEVYKSSV